MEEKLLYLISWIILFCSILIIFIKYGIKENLFSPLNIFVFFQILPLIFHILPLFSKELYISFQASYLAGYLDYFDFYYHQSLNFIGYAFFNIMLFIFLVFFKYSNLKFSNNYFFRLNKLEILSLCIFLTLYLLFILKDFDISEFNKNVLQLRYNLEHGYVVLLKKFADIFLVSFLVYLFSFKGKRNIFLTFIFIYILVVWILYGIMTGTRGFLISSIFFILFIKYNFLTAGHLIRRFSKGYIREYVLVGVIILIIFTFYYYYSVIIRSYQGHFLSVLSQRFDYIAGSCITIAKLGPSIHLEYIIFPLISYIPRDLFPSKPYSVTATITYEIFGFDESWSVAFGVVGESLYVLPVYG
ncbi:O-antigen polymerase [Thermodesulfovibrio sp. 1176]|uniref:O-antigen polymerase n=1 Tax=Thermodesulfovibrio sp. 1176 TaxID=3043424 RepID=UPI0024830B08|nr:O-antigen polymerase [Thermodesulfovibrio sp. 1176]MDI1471636.1 O-antigen polymerase [Thermodesulfovibrio sp. 1176]